MPVHRGYATFLDPTAATPAREYDTVTCGHCQRVIFLKPGTGGSVYLLPRPTPDQPYPETMGAFCGSCQTPVCLPCHADGRCTPFERQLEAMEARGRLRRQVGA